jgi:hypothetical protein
VVEITLKDRVNPKGRELSGFSFSFLAQFLVFSRLQKLFSLSRDFKKAFSLSRDYKKGFSLSRDYKKVLSVLGRENFHLAQIFR